MLPPSRAGGMPCLPEMLADRGGREELHRLAQDLKLEADDLLPIVDACVLLGFLRVEHGDAEITELGRKVAAGDIQQRKQLFREAVLAHVPLLHQMASALPAKADGTMPPEFFPPLLSPHFTHATP